jgi:hypothetical protein
MPTPVEAHLTHFSRRVAGLCAALAAIAALLIAVSSASAAAPANDGVANAQVIPAAGGSFAATNVDATAQAGEPHSVDFLERDRATIWYRWTAPSDGDVTFDACTGADFHMVMVGYTKDADPVPPFTNLTDIGSVGEDLAPTAGCDTENGAAAKIQAPSPGVTYYLQIAGFAGTPGSQSAFTLKVNQESVTPPTTPPPLPPAPTPKKKKKGAAKKKCKKAKKGVATSAKKKCKK